MFEDYRIESANSNEIWIQVTGQDFSKAFKSAHNADAVIMKLTKRDNLPVLSFSITTKVNDLILFNN